MKKSYIIPITLVIALVMTLTLASAAVTWRTPAAGTNYSTAIQFRVSYVNGSDIVIHNNTGAQGMNSSLWYNLTSGGGAWNQINISGLGYSDNGSDLYFTLPIATLTDGTYRFNVTLANNSLGPWALSSAMTTPVIIDDTAPSITMDVMPIRITPGRVVNYYFSLSDSLSGISKAICTATDPEGTITSLGTSTTTTLTKGTSTSLMSFIDSRKEGTYKFNCSLTDTAGNSAFTQKNVTTEAVGSIAPYVVTQALQQKSKTNTLIIVGILGVIAYLLFKRNK